MGYRRLIAAILIDLGRTDISPDAMLARARKLFGSLAGLDRALLRAFIEDAIAPGPDPRLARV